jgi:spore coat polysaccharide biosynthesis protein SpsF (cytidylyltransferase family)
VSPIAVIQARVGSTRLPGKSIADIDGEPSLALLVKRLRHSRELGSVRIATSVNPADDAVAELAGELRCELHRGPEADVLTRFVEATSDVSDTIVRVTADCPLSDPQLVDELIGLMRRHPGAAYASNVEPRTFPVGLDLEAFPVDVLRAASERAAEPVLREHVTLLMRRHPDQFPHVSLTREDDLSGLRWTVDYPDDLEFVRRLVVRLGDRRYTAGMSEILAAVHQEPSLAEFSGRRG